MGKRSVQDQMYKLLLLFGGVVETLLKAFYIAWDELPEHKSVANS